VAITGKPSPFERERERQSEKERESERERENVLELLYNDMKGLEMVKRRIFIQLLGNTLLYIFTFCSGFHFILYGYKNPTLMFVAGERFFLKINC
jgi:hypothetical protein